MHKSFLLILLILTSWKSARGESESYLFLSEADEKQIVVYSRNPVDGSLRRLHEVKTSGEPGPLTANVTRNLLVASMRSTGELASFRIDPQTGQLTQKSLVPAGVDPAYVKIDQTGNWLLTAYYQAGKVTVHKIDKSGHLSKQPHQSVATNEKAHAVALDRTNRFMLVPHTGPNAIYQFRFDAQMGTLTPNQPLVLQLHANTGPRHLAFHPRLNVVYADNEQGSSVTQFSFDSIRGTLKAEATLSTIPADYSEPNSCARLELHPSGKSLYVANRGHDSIAMFQIDEPSGKLTSLGNAQTEKTPRSFSISSDGLHLYAAGQSADKLAVYEIQSEGRLKRTQTYETGKRPWWVLAATLSVD